MSSAYSKHYHLPLAVGLEPFLLHPGLWDPAVYQNVLWMINVLDLLRIQFLQQSSPKWEINWT